MTRAAPTLGLRERNRLRTRADITGAALATPLTEFAESMVDVAPSNNRLLTRLVMTTPALEARSLRLRLRWEREVAHQLAHEAGRTTTVLEDTLIAAVAVSCLTSALRHWNDSGTSGGLTPLVQQAFERCGAVSGPSKRRRPTSARATNAKKG